MPRCTAFEEHTTSSSTKAFYSIVSIMSLRRYLVTLQVSYLGLRDVFNDIMLTFSKMGR